VIAASDLNEDKEDKLLKALRKNKEAMSWTLGDIKRYQPLHYESQNSSAK